MSTYSTGEWQSYPVPELGISLEFPPNWPVQTAVLEGASYIYQTIPEVQGAMYIRFGDGETLQHFAQTTGDALTSAAAGEPYPARLGNIEAECVDLTLETPEHAMHRESAMGVHKEVIPAIRKRMSVCRFLSPTGVSVLIAWRVPEQHLPEWTPTLTRFLHSPRSL